MAIRNIVKEPDEVLHKVCRPVENFNERLAILLDDMKETMQQAQGVGLAAPQVGLLRRICVVDTGEGIVELINPKVTVMRGTQDGVEGCLSVPGEWGMVKRPMKVTVEAFDRTGKPFTVTGEGLTARAFCHEIDHLNGIMFTQQASRMLTPDELEED